MIDIAVERFLLVVVVAAAQWLVGRNSGKQVSIKGRKQSILSLRKEKPLPV